MDSLKHMELLIIINKIENYHSDIIGVWGKSLRSISTSVVETKQDITYIIPMVYSEADEYYWIPSFAGSLTVDNFISLKDAELKQEIELKYNLFRSNIQDFKKRGVVKLNNTNVEIRIINRLYSLTRKCKVFHNRLIDNDSVFQSIKSELSVKSIAFSYTITNSIYEELIIPVAILHNRVYYFKEQAMINDSIDICEKYKVNEQELDIKLMLGDIIIDEELTRRIDKERKIYLKA